MNNTIHSNLEKEFNINLKELQKLTFNELIDDYIKTTGDYVNSNDLDNSMFLDEVSEIVLYKDNAELIEAFEKTKNFDIDELAIKNNLIQEIKPVLKELSQNQTNEKIKALLIGPEYYDEKHIISFSVGTNDEYTYLEKWGNLYSESEEELFYNTNQEEEESFYTIGQIDLSSIVKNYKDFMDLTIEKDCYDYILSAPSIRFLVHSYDYKVYMFLNEVFAALEEKIRNEKLFDTPLHIYYCLEGAGISIHIIE